MAATLETSVRTVTTDLARIAEEDRARAVGHQTALDDAQDVFRLVRQKAWGAAEAAAAATRHPQVVRFMRVVVRATRAQLRLLKQAGGATKLQ